ncbi:MAG: AMP-binding protein, partial [Actinobacteria bacterium]|nr:AMP-binding protein [Actinomycetota bacterium]
MEDPDRCTPGRGPPAGRGLHRRRAGPADDHAGRGDERCRAGRRRGLQHRQVRGRRRRGEGAGPGHPGARRQRAELRVRPGRPLVRGPHVQDRPGEPGDGAQPRRPAQPGPAQELLTVAGTLAGLIRELGRTRADAPAVTLGDTTLTFGELDARSNRVARALVGDGIGPGDRVGVLDKNAPTFFEVVFGAAKVGAVTVGLNFRLAAPEVTAVVEDAAPRLVVADPEFVHLLPVAGPAVVRLGEEYEAWLSDDDSDPGLEPDPDAVVLQL